MLGLSALTLGASGVGCEASSASGPRASAASGPASEPGSSRSATGATGERAPVVFVGHGSPTLAVDAVKGAELRSWGGKLTNVRGVLVVSAHWAHRGGELLLGPLERSPLIYDFYGFPRELYQVSYAAPGGAPLAAEVNEALATVRRASTVRQTDRGLDHGSWTPLVHLFPAANIPVLQLSLPIDWGGAGWFELGEALAPLRERGILVMGSGNVTHNLRRIDPNPSGPVPNWAREFDAWVEGALSSRDLSEVARFAERAPALATNHPTLEHLAPLIVAAGAASASGARPHYPIQGWEHGSISRRSVEFS